MAVIVTTWTYPNFSWSGAVPINMVVERRLDKRAKQRTADYYIRVGISV